MGDRFFEWVNKRYVRVAVIVSVAAMLFGVSARVKNANDSSGSGPAASGSTSLT